MPTLDQHSFDELEPAQLVDIVVESIQDCKEVAPAIVSELRSHYSAEALEGLLLPRLTDCPASDNCLDPETARTHLIINSLIDD